MDIANDISLHDLYCMCPIGSTIYYNGFNYEFPDSFIVNEIVRRQIDDGPWEVRFRGTKPDLYDVPAEWVETEMPYWWDKELREQYGQGERKEKLEAYFERDKKRHAFQEFNREDCGMLVPRDEGGDPPKMYYGIDVGNGPDRTAITRWFEPVHQPYIDEYGSCEIIIIPKKRRHGSDPGSWWHRQMKRMYENYFNPGPSIKRGRMQIRRAFNKHKAPFTSTAAGKPTVEITLTEDNFYKP